jgi:hypothetical protein
MILDDDVLEHGIPDFYSAYALVDEVTPQEVSADVVKTLAVALVRIAELDHA